MSEHAGKITPQGVRRIRSTVEGWERFSKNRPPERSKGPGRGVAFTWAIVGGTPINAATAGTPPVPASGAATVWNWNSASSTWVAGGTITALNIATGTGAGVAAGTLIGCQWIDGEWWIVWVLC